VLGGNEGKDVDGGGLEVKSRVILLRLRTISLPTFRQMNELLFSKKESPKL
jgi:hypothetical protein